MNTTPTTGNSRSNALSRATVLIILFVNMPQILASIIVLSIHWNDKILINCNQSVQAQWKVWAVISTIRMAIYSFIVFFMFVFKPILDQNHRLSVQINGFRNLTDGFGLIWFIVGNMWLFGDDTSTACLHPQKSSIYNLCVSMLIINYIQICLPCILAALMIPLFCFCMPCLIRIMARYNRTVQGASQDAINLVPSVILGTDVVGQLGTDDVSCPICLSEMVTGDEVRLLNCKHSFHKQVRCFFFTNCLLNFNC